MCEVLGVASRVDCPSLLSCIDSLERNSREAGPGRGCRAKAVTTVKRTEQLETRVDRVSEHANDVKTRMMRTVFKTDV